jgi:hypothetical protein
LNYVYEDGRFSSFDHYFVTIANTFYSAVQCTFGWS